MRKLFCNGLTFALLLAVPATASAEPTAPHIIAYGTATLQVAPDRMVWLLTVRNTAPAGMDAAKIHEMTVASVMDFLKKSQIAERTIQTSRMQLGENWNYVRNERKLEGYYASTDIQFTLDDFGRYASIYSGLSAIAGVQLNNVSLDHSERIRFQNEARTQAVLAAREKAKAMAETLGTRVAEPLAIEEDLAAVEGYRSMMPSATNAILSNEVRPAGASAEGGQFVAPGTISIRARVKTTFELKNK